jgi:hypothetical protein
MDCDQVFMILTRGPFPTGEPTDEQVEAHLEACGDCWRLAEALRPALEVFQEAVPAIESRELPGYWGDARPAHVSVSGRTSTAARRAPAKLAPKPLAVHHIPQDAHPGSYWRADVLPAVAVASAVTALVIGLVLLLRG